MVEIKGVLKMQVPKPFFLKNKDWYYYDEKEQTYKLTDKAPSEAIESYEEFYKPFNTHCKYG